MTFAGTGIPPWALAVAAMFMIQFGSALSVPVVEAVGPAGATFLRMAFGSVLLWMFTRPDVRSIRRTDLPVLLGLGISTGLMTTSFLSALERIPLGTTVAIEFLGPLTVAGFTSRNKRALIWPVLAFVGVVLMTEPWVGSVDPVGIAFAAGAGACWGFYIIFAQRGGDRFSGVTSLTFSIPISALVAMPLGIPQIIDGALTWQLLLLVVAIALLTPTVSLGLEIIALKRMHRSAFGTLMAIEPAIAMLVGLLVLFQLPEAWQLAGIVLVVIAGAAAQRGSTR